MQNKHIHFYIVGFIAFVLAACKVSKEYQRPALELPERFNGTSYADTSSIADIEWKVFFTDPGLQQLIDRGIKYNNDLQIAIKRIDIAQARVKQARLLQLPEINAQVSGQISRPSDNSLNGISTGLFLGKSYVENYNASVNISWEADIWGRIRRQKETVLAGYLQTQEAAKAVQTQLISNIAQGYFNLLMLDRQLEIAGKNLALSDTILKATSLLKESGDATALAVQQAAAQKQSTALLIPQLQQDIAIQENALQVLTGQFPSKISRSSGLTNIAFTDRLSTGLPIAILSRRPDVRAAELALVAANARVGISKARMYPGLNITVGGGIESYQFKNWFDVPNSLFGLAAGAIAQPVFNRRRLKTDYEVAMLERDQEVIYFKQSILTATSEVENALVNIEKLKEQYEIADSRAGTLNNAVANARLLFNSALANYLEVIIAQGNALQAELGLAVIQRNRLTATVDLYRSLGGGWK